MDRMMDGMARTMIAVPASGCLKMRAAMTKGIQKAWCGKGSRFHQGASSRRLKGWMNSTRFIRSSRGAMIDAT